MSVASPLLRRLAAAAAALALPSLVLAGCQQPRRVVSTTVNVYGSPYQLRYSVPTDQLTSDFSRSPWNDPHQESDTPYADWYSPATLAAYTSWGPRVARYPVPSTANPTADW
jgi:hypothetical protein